MKVTTREVKFRDPNGRMVSSLVIGNGSLHDEVADYLDNNPEPVATATGEWLTENITQPTTPVVDASLSVSGAAADAKVTGDRIGDLTDLITEDQSSLVGAINETRTDLYNWFSTDLAKVRNIYDGSASDADIYEIQRLEFTSADDADITGLKVVSRKEGTSVDTSKFFADTNELMDYVITPITDDVADAKEDISELKSHIGLIDRVLTETETVSLDGVTSYNVVIASSTGLWSAASNNLSYFLPVTAGETYKITANADLNSIIALLANSSHNHGTEPNYATGGSRTVIPAGTSQTFEIPSDCTYMYIVSKSTAGTHTPSDIKKITYKSVPVIDNTLTIEGDGADAKVVGNKFSKYDSLLYETVPYTVTDGVLLNRWIINSSNEWSSNAGRSSYFIPIEDEVEITVTAKETNTTAIAFLKDTTHSQNATPNFCDGYNSRIIMSEGEIIKYAIPNDCEYVWIEYTFNNSDYAPESIEFKKVKQFSSETLPIGLHTMPKNKGVLNVIKRCRQMTDIRWTPAVDLPRYIYAQATPPSDEGYNVANVKKYLGVFKAGTEYKGIPYGRADYLDDYGYTYSFVGLNVDFETFVTAVQNSESILCKEISGSVSGHRSMQYASVCSSLTCYALGLSTYYPTENIPSIPGLNLVSALKVGGEYIDPNIFELGDVLNLQGDHTSVITDLIKDENGDVIYIEESEATVSGNANPDYVGGETGGVCRRVGFNVDDFFARYGEYSLYRYANIANVTYTPSKFVNVGDEFDMARFDRLPCMPYMGENFQYKNGYIPNTKVVITTDDYNYLRVYKDGTEITGSPFAVNGASFVETGFSETGNYIAYLCNMSDGANTIVSAKCHWTVV